MSKFYNVANLLNKEVSKKLLCILLVVMGVFGTAKAQISVTATLANVGPTNYTTLKDAFDAINAGTHQGNITVTVTGNTLESATAILNSSAAPSFYNSVVVKPNGANRVITGNVSPSIVKLSGADNVTIDGSQTPGGTSRDLTFSNTSTSTSTGVIWVGCASGVDGANNNTIKNCIVTGNAATTTLVGITQSSGTTLGGIAETANSNNTYDNNQVSAAQNGIGVFGVAGNEDGGTVISGNTISSLEHTGIWVAQQKGVLVTANTISGINSSRGGLNFQTSGILVGGTIVAGGLIEKNRISDIKIQSVWGCNGIQLNSSSASNGLVVANNMIYDIAAGGFGTADTVDDNGFGIAVVLGSGYKIYYNSIDLSTNQPAGGITAAFWVGGSIPAGGLDIRNNIFANRQTTATRYAIFSNTAATVFGTINFNDYYSLGVVGFLTSQRTTLANWQAVTGQDGGSVAILPDYTNTTDLHLLGSSFLNGLATPIAGTTTDFDNQPRDPSVPDIGCDEFTPPACTNPPNNGFLATASVTEICGSGSATLTSSGFSYGSGIVYTWQWATNVAGTWNPLGSSNPLSASTGVISTTTFFRLKVQCSGGPISYSDTIQIDVNNSVVTGTTPGSRCGVGTVQLAATGGTVKWYTASTGGTPIGVGSPFTTPLITATTQFWVSSTTGATPCVGGKPSTTGVPDGGYNGTDAGLVFDATQQFTIDSVKMYPQAAGAVMIQLVNSAGTVLQALPTPFNFTGATSTGVYVPLNFTVPAAGTGYRLVISNNASSISIWRDFGGNAFPYTLCSVGAITGGWITGNVGTYYFFYDWHITTGCESTRTGVFATVTPPPAFTTFSPAVGARTICSGGSVTLNATGGGYTTYVWNPGNLPNGSVVSPATTTTYTLTADIPGGCRRDSIITIQVNQMPTPLTITPSAVSLCPNIDYSVVVAGGIMNNLGLFSETAEVFPFSQWTVTNLVPAAPVVLNQNTTYYQQGASSMWMTHGDLTDGAVATTNPISLVGITNPSLTFYHIAALEATSTNHYDVGYVEVSIDGGTNWVKINPAYYQGSGTLINGFVAFDNTSYPDWDGQFSGPGSTPGTGPATSLWKQEIIDLSNWAGNANFKIRFHLVTDGSVLYYGWLVDNIKITGTGRAPITWSSNANMWTDGTHGTLITAGSGDFPNPHYFATVNTAPVTYTATATGGVGCSTTANVTISATSATPSVTISANPAGAVCAQTPVTFTALPVNGGTTAGYNWMVNSVTVSGGSQVGMISITLSNLNDQDTVKCIMSVAGSPGCYPGGFKDTSNEVIMTIHPKPTANAIVGSTGTTVCTGAPNLLTETPTGTITNYQWYFNSGPVGSNSSTYSAALPGTYTVAVTTNFGCKDTSAPLIITQPTYTITASSGGNGTVSPIGTVVVNCGDNATFTITPNAGYAIQTVLVDGVNNPGAVASGTYTFTNVVANGHTINATFFISGCADPALAYAGPDAIMCSGSNFTLNAAVDSVGGSATSGTWQSSGTGTFNPDAVFGSALTYTPSAADIIAGSVVITLETDDPPGLCLPSTSSFTLTIKTSPSVTITGNIGLCTAGTLTSWIVADTSATTVHVTGFTWNHPIGTPIGTNNDSLLVAAGQTGNYNVTVMGSNGCTATNQVAINFFTNPTVTLPLTAGPICTNTSVDINATASGGSGTYPPNGYTWYLGATPQGTNTSILAASAAGSYTVTVRDSHGCLSAASSPPLVLSLDNSMMHGNYTIGVGPASCTNYLTFKQAILDLNSRGIDGDCFFSVPAGYTETAPVDGLILGNIAAGKLNSHTATGLAITFLKTGAGANPKITAPSLGAGGNGPASNKPDGIFKLRGVDNVSINQIDLAENPANSGTALMEFGYGLFRGTTTDGARNNTIQGCTITLNRTNNVAGAGQMCDGSGGIVVINAIDTTAFTAITPASSAGTNSNNKFYGNTITNVHNGFWLAGTPGASPYTLCDVNNDIGGASAATGNSIINFGVSGDPTAASAVKLNEQWNANVSYNTIENNVGNVAGMNTTQELRGIYAINSAGASATFSGNNITLKSSTTGSNAVVGIDNGIGSSPVTPNTININNNTITGSCSVTAVGAPFTGVANSASASTVNISGNIIQNITLSGTGIFAGISSLTVNVPVALNINSNTITGNSKTGTGNMNGIYITEPAANPINIVSNIISNNTLTGGAASQFNGINGSLGVFVVDGNTIYNNAITTMSGTAIGGVYGFFNNSANVGNETFTDNIIRKLSVGGTSSGLHVVRGISTITGSATRTILRNQIDTLYTALGSTGAISAIHSGITGAVTSNVSISNNKIHSLFPGTNGTSTNPFAKGISVTGGTTVKVFNNMINLDLTRALAPLPANNGTLRGANSVAGIEMSGGTTVLMYYNTVRLAGSGGATTFGSSGISLTAASGTVDIRNNLVSSIMTPGATGFAASLRKTGAVTHATTSNNNLWFNFQGSSTPIYYTTAATSTLSAYQLAVTPRDSLAIGDYPVFVDSVNNDLHLQPGNNCSIDGMGQFIPNYPDDYDATLVRDSTAPDIGCDEFDGTGGSGVWKGVNTNWLDPKNWCGVVPTVTTNVIIPKRFSGKYPIIPTGVTTPVANSITIDKYASITLDAGGKLSNKGQWLINGTLTNNGTIELNGTSNQLFPNVASTGIVAAMTNLTVTNPGGATIDKNLTLTGVLKPNQGTITINNNDTLTLHSDATGTASVDTVKVGAAIAYVGTGKFVIERFISSFTKVGWRFLGVPLKPAVTQTIHEAWQENQAAGAAISTGFGMQIVGPTSAGAGFDLNNTLPSVKKYDIPSATWVPIPGTLGPIASPNGYMAFIRGDRSKDLFGEFGATTLRTAGQINTGPVTVSALNTETSKYLSVANPYPSAISFASTSTVKTGLLDFYYLWDPQLGTYGGYVTFGGPTSYTPSPSGGSYNANNAIESGQAFFVYTSASVGVHSIQMVENSKSSSNVQVARMSALDKQLETRLFVVSGGNLALFDGNRVDFDNSYSNAVDAMDAPKMVNFNENFGLRRDGNVLSIERHAEIAEADTVFFNLNQFRVQEYQLEFNPKNLAAPGLAAWLEDNFLHTSTVVDLSAVTTVNFTVTSDAASRASDRFRIVFRQQTVVPLSFTSVAANRQGKNILVDWRVENELNIATYEVEGSSNGTNFRKLSSQPARGNGTGISLQYNWLDEHPVVGNNYYRIKSIGTSGAVKYSQIVKVNMAGDPSLITVYPNPVKDRMLRVALTNMDAGDYDVKMYAPNGQLVLQQTLNHLGGNQSVEIPIQGTIAKAVYNLEISLKNGKKQVFRVMIE